MLQDKNPQLVINGVYQIRLQDAATGNEEQHHMFSRGEVDREKWVAIAVIDGKHIKIRHATTAPIKRHGVFPIPNSQSPIPNIDQQPLPSELVLRSDFQNKNCQSAQGKTARMPFSQTIWWLIDQQHHKISAIISN